MFATFPKLPFAGFPLRPHRNGQWYKSAWNPRTKKTEKYYFGAIADDPQGQRAIHDRTIGWLARRDGIKAGVDNIRIEQPSQDLSLGELMERFLTFKRNKVTAGELSLVTLKDYLNEIKLFVSFMKSGMPVTRPSAGAFFGLHESTG